MEEMGEQKEQEGQQGNTGQVQESPKKPAIGEPGQGEPAESTNIPQERDRYTITCPICKTIHTAFEYNNSHWSNKKETILGNWYGLMPVKIVKGLIEFICMRCGGTFYKIRPDRDYSEYSKDMVIKKP